MKHRYNGVASRHNNLLTRLSQRGGTRGGGWQITSRRKTVGLLAGVDWWGDWSWGNVKTEEVLEFLTPALGQVRPGVILLVIWSFFKRPTPSTFFNGQYLDNESGCVLTNLFKSSTLLPIITLGYFNSSWDTHLKRPQVIETREFSRINFVLITPKTQVKNSCCEIPEF